MAISTTKTKAGFHKGISTPSNFTAEMVVDSIVSAINNLEIDPILSRKAYKMRLDNVIESDEYNPNKERVGRPNGRCTSDVWVNHIPAHSKPTCLMIVNDIFEMLESGTGSDDKWGKHLQSRITELFINLRSYNLEVDHFKKIRHFILKTLDSYGEIDLMMKVKRFD